MPMELKGFPGFKFGCDPELFILDAKQRPVSAAGIIPGTKEKPHPVPGGAIQRDGMAAEFNIEPVDNFRDFNSNMSKVIKSLESFLPEGHTLAALPAVRFDKDVFEKAPDDAKELGCSPDMDAWTGEINPPPLALDDPYLRTASGHIHIGWADDMDITDESHVANCRDLVKQLDWFLGAWSIRMDSDPSRRKLYGRAGACRIKPYGVEYRVLSNFWVLSRDRRLTVWNRMQEALNQMRSRFMPDFNPEGCNTIVEYINASKLDKDLESKFTYPVRTLDTYYARKSKSLSPTEQLQVALAQIEG